jgi:hypothetical protein
MLLIEWWILWRLCIGLLLVVVGGLGLWAVRKRRRTVRLFVQFLFTLVALGGVSALLLMWWGISTSHDYSAPVYSPNQKMAVRIDDYNARGFGGSYNSVELFSAHGFRSDEVFSEEWKAVETASLRWKSDSELEISYQGTVGTCASTVHVKVRCIGK